MNLIDFHVHIFPDRIAKQALGRLAEESGDYRPRTDGTLGGLLASMDEAGIRLSVAANIATNPGQLVPIYEFSLQVMSDRIVPLLSFHPGNSRTEVEELFRKASERGIKGVKLHPMYQEFFIDDRKMFDFYALVERFGFFLLFHTGYDIAFPGNTQADVERVRTVADEFRNLIIVTTHVGGWKQWDRAGILARCANVYTETSMTLTEIDDAAFIRALLQFDEDRILFGTDSPWTGQKEMVERTMSLRIPDRVKEKLFFTNGATLLEMTGRQ